MAVNGNNEITGRDDWIMAKALHVAIRALGSKEDPPSSDVQDMALLLRERYPGYAEALLDHEEYQQALQAGLTTELWDRNFKDL